ncbi:MAG TPA: hypothetical protein VF241_10060, partial [Propionibacteriaceae bacterium]
MSAPSHEQSIHQVTRATFPSAVTLRDWTDHPGPAETGRWLTRSRPICRVALADRPEVPAQISGPEPPFEDTTTRTVRVGGVTVWGRMVRRTLFVLGVVIGGIVAFAGLVLVAMLTKSPRLLDAVRWFNRTFTNRLQRPFAGKPGAYASVIRHQGRRSGRSYETPIVPFATDDGFIVSLPYGPTADWVQNVLALGSAVLIHEGRTLTVDRPEVVPVAQVEDL